MKRLAWAALFATVAAGCDDTFVDPFLRDAAPYSMYGLIVADVTSQPQQVRVQRVRALAEPPTAAEGLGGRVSGSLTSADPRSGETLVWDRTEVEYADGTLGVVYRRSFQALPDSRLGVVFTDDAGREARTEAVIPPAPPGTVGDPFIPDPVAGFVLQRVAWEGARFLPEARVEYTGVDSVRSPATVEATYPVAAAEGGGFVVEVELTRDLIRLAGEVGVDDDGFIRELRVRMTTTALSDDLPPADVVPTEDLGRAFVAGAAVGRVTWSPAVRPVAGPDSGVGRAGR